MFLLTHAHADTSVLGLYHVVVTVGTTVGDGVVVTTGTITGCVGTLIALSQALNTALDHNSTVMAIRPVIIVECFIYGDTTKI